MFEINFNKVMQDLVSEDFETQCVALESIGESFKVFAEQSVRALETTSNPFLIVERLANLGSVIVLPLEEFIERTADYEKRVLASILLLRLGSNKGINNVIDELRTEGKNEYLATIVLAESRNPQVKDLFTERLRKFSLEELQDSKRTAYIDSFLKTLRELNVSLPEDIRDSFGKIKDSPTYQYYMFAPEFKD